ncbi:MAG: choice-of-anchor B family protein [Lewinellaceae bacterium]|nr:choice-of-anchor B family protein [Lewinellaceae bacterium]
MKLLHFLAFLLLTLGIPMASSAQNQNITFRSKLSFPGQTVANMCGWSSPTGQEYALVGASKGLIIVDVTNPDAPVQIVQVPGPDDFWKEIKTYSHYAYVVSEGGQGVQIVDLSALPSPNLPNKFYKGDGAILNQLDAIHALHIDVTKGFLYTYGSNNLFSGGALVMSLNDPWNPSFVGKFDALGYIHDGYVDNDTLYAGHINAGLFSIVDMTNKAAPVLLNTQTTPTNFTHNTWLSEDRKTIFTTDETGNSFLASYDVSDPSDIQFLDKMQTNPGSGSIVHNTHIRGNYAITSWYTQGVTIVDVTNPNNLVETGNYDTYPQGSGGGFDGCWGVYPYLPSGNLVASNITPGELWVLTPSYQRACYLEGKITDAANGQPLAGATVEIVGVSTSAKTTGANGLYHTGQAQAGMAQVLVTKFGYEPAFAAVNLITGEVVMLDVALTAASSYTVGGLVQQSGNAAPIPNAHVSIISPDASYEITTDASGQFSIPNVVGGLYDIVAGAWGYRYKVQNQVVNTNQQIVLELEEGYQDDFVFDYGWQKSGSSAGGIWERTDAPLAVVFNGFALSPGEDVTGDVGFSCYVTGNSSADIDADDVESGTSILTSPVMDLSGYLNPRISAQVFCLAANVAQQFVDSIKVYVSNGTQEKLAWKRKGDNFDWQLMEFDVTDFVPLSSTMSIRVVCFDNPNGTILDTYEAALDQFNVLDQPLGTANLEQTSTLSAMPNPFNGTTVVQYENVENQSVMRVFDLSGRTVQTFELAGDSGQVIIGGNLPKGVYFVRIEQEGQVSKALKVVKVN